MGDGAELDEPDVRECPLIATDVVIERDEQPGLGTSFVAAVVAVVCNMAFVVGDVHRIGLEDLRPERDTTSRSVKDLAHAELRWDEAGGQIELPGLAWSKPLRTKPGCDGAAVFLERIAWKCWGSKHSSILSQVRTNFIIQ